MDKFKKLIKEINSTFSQIIILDISITAVLIFLIIYLFLSLLNLYPLLSALPAAIYFVSAIIKRSKKSKTRIIEEKYPFLDEKLRTAADNAALDNPVVSELKDEVISDIKRVGISSFVRTKSLSWRIFFCVILAFTIVFISTFHLEFLDIEYLIGNVPKMLENNGGEDIAIESIEDVNQTDDIYGNKDIAVLGNEELDIKIRPSSFKVSVKETGEYEAQDFDEIFPGSVDIESSDSFKEEIAIDDQELVKNYFEKINK